MKTVFTRPVVTFFLLLPLVFALLSCSGDDYLNAVPENSTAVVSIDLKRLAGTGMESSGADKLKSLFQVDDVEDCGIDLSEKLYLFETVEGNLGLVAKVSDRDDLDSWLEKMSASGFCKKTFKRKDCLFTVIKGSWVAGFTSDALMIIGPVLPAGQAEVCRRITEYLGQDEEMGIKSSPLSAKLDSITSPIAIVAQAAALPEKFVAPFTIGAPKDADASQVMIAAGVEVNKGFLEITGQPFSFNANIDKSLNDAYGVFRPITDRYLECMPGDAFLGAFMNVEGSRFITLLHDNKAFQALLTGVNMAIDMDKIIKSIDGDMAVVMPVYGGDGPSVSLAAKLGNKDFLGDVGYWKQSCPAGSSITDAGKDAYCYTGGGISYCFGVSGDMQYYSGRNPEEALKSISKASVTLPQDLRAAIKGGKLCFVVNLKALESADGSGLLHGILSPVFGNVGYILYNVK